MTMKTLRQFLEEAQQVHSFSKTILDNYSQAPFIIRHSVWTKIKNSTIPQHTKKSFWHVTNIKGFSFLLNKKGRKTPISTFSRPDARMGIFRGVETSGGILLKVKGNVGEMFNFDAYTGKTDSSYRTILLNGYEWKNFIIRKIKDPSIIEIHKKMTEFLVSIVPKWLGENGIDVSGNLSDKLTGTQKKELIKFYLDESEKFVLQNNNKIKNLFSFSNATETSYNEIVIEYPEIEEAYFYGDPKSFDAENFILYRDNDPRTTKIKMEIINRSEIDRLFVKQL